MELEDLFEEARENMRRRSEEILQESPPGEHQDHPARQEIRHYEQAIAEFSEENIKAVTSMTVSELDAIIEAIHTTFVTPAHRGRKSYFNSKDICFLIIIYFSTGWDMHKLALFMQSDSSTVNHIISKNLHAFSSKAVQLWIPTQITSEQTNLLFTHFPDSIGAVDTSLLPIRTPSDKNLRQLLYSSKHKQHGFKFQNLIAPNEICLHISPLREGSVHDKRVFDESPLPNALKHYQTLQSGNTVQVRYSCIFDSGYQGLHQYYREAIIPTRKPPHDDLSPAEYTRNQELHSDRVVVEHFYGHLKMCFSILFNEFRGEHKNLQDIAFATTAIVNCLNKIRGISRNMNLNLQPPPRSDQESPDRDDVDPPLPLQYILLLPVKEIQLEVEEARQLEVEEALQLEVVEDLHLRLDRDQANSLKSTSTRWYVTG
jgi:hypothetical protein